MGPDAVLANIEVSGPQKCINETEIVNADYGLVFRVAAFQKELPKNDIHTKKKKINVHIDIHIRTVRDQFIINERSLFFVKRACIRTFPKIWQFTEISSQC